MKKMGCLIVLVVLLGLGLGVLTAKYHWLPLYIPWLNQGTGQVEILAEGGPDNETMQDVQKAAQGFQNYIEQNMNTRLQRDIKVYVAGSAAAYQDILTDQFDLSAENAKEIAEVSGGWTGGYRAVTAINGKAGVMQGPGDRYSTTAHELFHQLQYELSHGEDTDNKALFWLEEGSADYVGAQVAAQLGRKDAAKWPHDVELELLSAKAPIAPEKLLHTDADGRRQLMQRDYHSYAMADLMTWYLLQQHAQGQELAKLFAYFEALQDEDGEKAFAAAFGISLDDFLKEYEAWWQSEQQQPAQLHFFAAGSGVDADAIEQDANLARGVLVRNLGSDFYGNYDVLLAKDQQGVQQAAMKFAGLSQNSTKNLSQNSLWLENGSTLILNTAKLENKEQSLFSLGTMLTRVMIAQRLGYQKHNLEWLEQGLSYYMGVLVLADAGYGDVSAYRASWQETLRSDKAPSLNSLATTEGFNKAAQSYQDTPAILAEYAASFIVERYGWQGVNAWLNETRSSGDADKAFLSTFGLTTETFERQVQQSLRQSAMYTRAKY